jgi:hypothetical protein
MPVFFSPKSEPFYRAAHDEGFARPGARRQRGSFEVAAAVAIVPNHDIEAAADAVRPTLALYIGGMGAAGANFHYEVFARMGYEAECAKIQQLYLSGNKREAIAAVPTRMVEDVYLVGPMAKIKDDLQAWKASCVTTLLVGGPPPLLNLVADAVL